MRSKIPLLQIPKTNYKNIIYAIIGIIAFYSIIKTAINSSKIPSDLKATIDSLTNANKILIEKQKQIDSSIHVFETEVKHIDNKISHTKEQTTVINEYYNNASQQAERYDATQIDSFFKARYKY